MKTFDKERCLAGGGPNIVLDFTAIFSRVRGFSKEEGQRGRGVVFGNRAVSARNDFFLVFEPFDDQRWSSREQNIEMNLRARQDIHGFGLFENAWWF